MNENLRLYNRGPYAETFRGDVVLHADGRMTWHGTDNEVQSWHGDFVSASRSK